MPETPKKRPRFQFSLLTAIVAMLAASGLLWLNMKLYLVAIMYDNCNSLGVGRGWPFCYFNDASTVPLDYRLLILDALLGLGILVLVATLCESLVRRRDRLRKQREGSK